nr:sigma-70 family RNA polymerase sigma factor [Clostridium perfringens]
MELTSVVNSLSEDLRITTVLYYFEDMSTKEISEMLNIAEGTVRSRLARAREKLRDFI